MSEVFIITKSFHTLGNFAERMGMKLTHVVNEPVIELFNFILTQVHTADERICFIRLYLCGATCAVPLYVRAIFLKLISETLGSDTPPPEAQR